MTTEHALDFEVAPWHIPEFDRFRVGTCDGLWRCTNDAYEILVITNNRPGNGHLNDVFQWFEHSCKRDKKSLRVLELWNDSFANHLINKRGFIKEGADNLIKHFNP